MPASSLQERLKLNDRALSVLLVAPDLVNALEDLKATLSACGFVIDNVMPLQGLVGDRVVQLLDAVGPQTVDAAAADRATEGDGQPSGPSRTVPKTWTVRVGGEAPPPALDKPLTMLTIGKVTATTQAHAAKTVVAALKGSRGSSSHTSGATIAAWNASTPAAISATTSKWAKPADVSQTAVFGGQQANAVVGGTLTAGKLLTATAVRFEAGATGGSASAEPAAAATSAPSCPPLPTAVFVSSADPRANVVGNLAWLLCGSKVALGRPEGESQGGSAEDPRTGVSISAVLRNYGSLRRAFDPDADPVDATAVPAPPRLRCPFNASQAFAALTFLQQYTLAHKRRSSVPGSVTPAALTAGAQGLDLGYTTGVPHPINVYGNATLNRKQASPGRTLLGAAMDDPLSATSFPPTVDIDQLLAFIFPPGVAHPRTAGRLLAVALYGPLNADGTLGGGRAGSRRLTELELGALIDDIERDDVLRAYVGGWDPSRTGAGEGIADIEATVRARTKLALPRLDKEQVLTLLAPLPRDPLGRVSFHDFQSALLQARADRVADLGKLYPSTLRGHHDTPALLAAAGALTLPAPPRLGDGTRGIVDRTLHATRVARAATGLALPPGFTSTASLGLFNATTSGVGATAASGKKAAASAASSSFPAPVGPGLATTLAGFTGAGAGGGGGGMAGASSTGFTFTFTAGASATGGGGGVPAAAASTGFGSTGSAGSALVRGSGPQAQVLAATRTASGQSLALATSTVVPASWAHLGHTATAAQTVGVAPRSPPKATPPPPAPTAHDIATAALSKSGRLQSKAALSRTVYKNASQQGPEEDLSSSRMPGRLSETTAWKVGPTPASTLRVTDAEAALIVDHLSHHLNKTVLSRVAAGAGASAGIGGGAAPTLDNVTGTGHGSRVRSGAADDMAAAIASKLTRPTDSGVPMLPPAAAAVYRPPFDGTGPTYGLYSSTGTYVPGGESIKHGSYFGDPKMGYPGGSLTSTGRVTGKARR